MNLILILSIFGWNVRVKSFATPFALPFLWCLFSLPISMFRLVFCFAKPLRFFVVTYFDLHLAFLVFGNLSPISMSFASHKHVRGIFIVWIFIYIFHLRTIAIFSFHKCFSNHWLFTFGTHPYFTIISPCKQMVNLHFGTRCFVCLLCVVGEDLAGRLNFVRIKCVCVWGELSETV